MCCNSRGICSSLLWTLLLNICTLDTNKVDHSFQPSACATIPLRSGKVVDKNLYNNDIYWFLRNLLIEMYLGEGQLQVLCPDLNWVAVCRIDFSLLGKASRLNLLGLGFVDGISSSSIFYSGFQIIRNLQVYCYLSSKKFFEPSVHTFSLLLIYGIQSIQQLLI